MPFPISHAYHSIHFLRLDRLCKRIEHEKKPSMKNWCCAATIWEWWNHLHSIEWLWSRRKKLAFEPFCLESDGQRFFPALKFGLIISTIVSCYADGTNCICGFFQWLYRNCEHEKKAEQQQKEPPVWNLFHVFESNVMAARKKWLNKKKNINKSKIMRLSWQ